METRTVEESSKMQAEISVLELQTAIVLPERCEHKEKALAIVSTLREHLKNLGYYELADHWGIAFTLEPGIREWLNPIQIAFEKLQDVLAKPDGNSETEHIFSEAEQVIRNWAESSRANATLENWLKRYLDILLDRHLEEEDTDEWPGTSLASTLGYAVSNGCSGNWNLNDYVFTNLVKNLQAKYCRDAADAVSAF